MCTIKDRVVSLLAPKACGVQV